MIKRGNEILGHEVRPIDLYKLKCFSRAQWPSGRASDSESGGTRDAVLFP